MGTHDRQGKQKNPFEIPAVRWGLAFMSAGIIAAIAFLFLEGTIRAVALAVAVVDLVTTPKILEMAAEESNEK